MPLSSSPHTPSRLDQPFKSYKSNCYNISLSFKTLERSRLSRIIRKTIQVLQSRSTFPPLRSGGIENPRLWRTAQRAWPKAAGKVMQQIENCLVSQAKTALVNTNTNDRKSFYGVRQYRQMEVALFKAHLKLLLSTYLGRRFPIYGVLLRCGGEALSHP